MRFEETNFKQMLERGLRLLEDELARLGPSEALSGEVAFRRNLSEDYTDVIISTTAVRGRISFDRTGTAEGNTTEIEIEGPTGTRRFTILATGKIGGLP